MSIFAELERGIVTASELETHAIARRLVTELPVDATLALSGDLGAGKTAFVRGLAAALNVRDPVTSPSYTLCNVYRGDRLLLHIDAYRLSSAHAWDSLMIEDFLQSPWCMAVEWPEHVADRLSGDAFWLRFDVTCEHSRVVRRIIPQTT